jgi:hypothetical protein
MEEALTRNKGRSQGHLERGEAFGIRIVLDRSSGVQTTPGFAAGIFSGSAFDELAVWVEVLDTDLARLELEANAF